MIELPTKPVREIMTEILGLTSYEPSERVNDLFTRLVRRAINGQADQSISPDDFYALQQSCMRAECELEYAWANDIVANPNPAERLKQFPYYDNYKRLTALEWSVTTSFCESQEKPSLVFVGGGAIPLTNIMLAQRDGVNSTVIDLDPKAVTLSSNLIRSLGLQDKVSVVQQEGQRYERYGNYDVIFLAALAGFNKSDKEAIFSRVSQQAKPGALVLARTVHGNREWLYPKLPPTIFNGFDKLVEVHPHNDIVNSFFIMKPR